MMRQVRSGVSASDCKADLSDFACSTRTTALATPRSPRSCHRRRKRARAARKVRRSRVCPSTSTSITRTRAATTKTAAMPSLRLARLATAARLARSATTTRGICHEWQESSVDPFPDSISFVCSRFATRHQFSLEPPFRRVDVVCECTDGQVR